MAFDPEKHRANQDKVLAHLREEFKLLPNLPQVDDLHAVAVEVGEDQDDSNFIICCHDLANGCKHHVIYPARCVDESVETERERDRIGGHVRRVLAAAYN